MGLDHQTLQQLSVSQLQPTGIAALSRRIHRDPALRNWVTLESAALPPIPVYRDGHWMLVSLLAVPTRLADGSSVWFTPWGAIVWSIPDLQVLHTLDLRQRDDWETLKQQGPVAAYLSAPSTRQALEQTLYQRLEQFFLNSPQPSQLSTLAPVYADLLAKESYCFYHQFIPDSQVWLHSKPNQPPETIPLQDTSDQLTLWLRQSLSLAESFKLSEIQYELDQLEQRQRIPGFRLAIVGEFSRGKSSCLNRLLERELLPVGVTPTTAALTSIVPASEEGMEVRHNGNQPEWRALTAEAWKDLFATDATGANHTVDATVRIRLDNAWLQTLDVELVDTPGAGDLNTERAAQVSDLLNQCDVAILVVSSTLPLSLTEKSFLEQEVIGRHVPRVLVVVSKLDTLEMEARSQVMQALCDRVAQVSPDIPVLPLHAIDPDCSDEQALDNIRVQIEHMAARDDRRFWRNRKIAGQLSDCLQQMVDVAMLSIETATLKAAEREQALQQLELSLATKHLQWEQIQLELDHRRIQRDRMFRQHISSAQGDLVEAFTLELSHVSEPKVWWEQDFPFRLRRGFVTLSRKSEEYLLSAIAQDLEWLDQAVKRQFTTQRVRPEPALGQLLLHTNLTAVQLSDTKRYRLLTRIGSSAAVLGGCLLGAPIGIVGSTGAWLVGEHLLTRTVKSQQHLLTQKLEQNIAGAIEDYCIAVSERLRQLYQQWITELQKEQQVWEASQRQVLQNQLQSSPELPWQSLAAQARALQQDIDHKSLSI